MGWKILRNALITKNVKMEWSFPVNETWNIFTTVKIWLWVCRASGKMDKLKFQINGAVLEVK